MELVSRVFRFPKDINCPDEYEDSSAVDEKRGVAAIADGVATVIFSQRWAQLLTQAIVSSPPDGYDTEEFLVWLQDVRQAWRAHVDSLQLDHWQQAKLKQCGGAFATLLWVEVTSTESGDTTGNPSWNWRSFAAGDCGLLHVRGNDVLRAFPIESSEQLKNDPLTVGSTDAADHLLLFETAEGTYEPGDFLVLCTDALLGWALRAIEGGEPPQWEQYWEMTEESWSNRVMLWREEGKIRFDDTTLVLLQLMEAATPEQTAVGGSDADVMSVTSAKDIAAPEAEQEDPEQGEPAVREGVELEGAGAGDKEDHEDASRPELGRETCRED